MRTRRLAAFIALLAIGLAAGSAYALLTRRGPGSPASSPGSAARASSSPAGTPSASPAVAATAVGRREAEVTAQLAKMTLREKVGQLFMTYVYGASANDRSPQMVAENRRLTGVSTGAELIAAYHLGGIVYLEDYTLDPNGVVTGNLQNPHQIAGLSNSLQRAAMAHGNVPLLIATDQEQGLVKRIGPPATQFPGNMALGADGRATDAF